MAIAVQVQNPREEIVEQLIRVHGEQLVKYLTRVLHQRAVAEEVAQDTYERLLRWGPLETRPAEARKAALFTIGYRLAIDRLRRRRAAERGDATVAAGYADLSFESLAQPERQTMALQAFAQVTAIVDSFPERLREPWRLRYIEELPRQVICAQLAISESNLDQRITEARALCEERMLSLGLDWFWLD